MKVMKDGFDEVRKAAKEAKGIWKLENTEKDAQGIGDKEQGTGDWG